MTYAEFVEFPAELVVESFYSTSSSFPLSGRVRVHNINIIVCNHVTAGTIL